MTFVHLGIFMMHYGFMSCDGFSASFECEDENLLQMCTVTASGDLERDLYDEFMKSISPELRAVVRKIH